MFAFYVSWALKFDAEGSTVSFRTVWWADLQNCYLTLMVQRTHNQSQATSKAILPRRLMMCKCPGAVLSRDCFHRFFSQHQTCEFWSYPRKSIQNWSHKPLKSVSEKGICHALSRARSKRLFPSFQLIQAEELAKRWSRFLAALNSNQKDYFSLGDRQVHNETCDAIKIIPRVRSHK